MIWIRSPTWDGLWLLSGLPLGAALTTAIHFGIPSGMILLWSVLLFSTAHAIAPIILAWSHPGFRQIAAQRWPKFVALPIAVLIISTAAGYSGGQTLSGVRFNPDTVSFSLDTPTFENLRNPFLAMALLYALWNGYHFGKQNFGVMSLYRGCVDGRRVDLWYCCGVTWLAMLMPFIPRLAHGLHGLTGLPAGPGFIHYIKPIYFAIALTLIPAMLWHERRTTRSPPRTILILTDGLGLVLIWLAGLWGFAILALNHWLVAIGLASHVQGNHTGRSPWLFTFGLIVLGTVIFAVLFIRPERYFEGWRWLSFTVMTVGFRLGLGFVHFLYDRWIWKMSNPQVRETIGRDLFPTTSKFSIAA